MGVPKQNQEQGSRRTKNSQKVASLDEQNRVLQRVLEASRNMDVEGMESPASKETVTEPSTVSTGEKENGGPAHDGKKGEKRPSESKEDGPPAKRERKPDKERTPANGTEGGKRGLILNYPDYVNFPLTDSGENRLGTERRDVNPESAGNVHTSLRGAGHEVEKMTARHEQHREHQLSSEDEDEINEEEQELSVFGDDDMDGGDGWDGHSVASSAIFPGVQNRTDTSFPPRAKKSSTHPEAALGSSSRPRSTDQNIGGFGDPSQAVQGGSNPVEDLVKERVGAEEAKDSMGPPVEACIADLLRVFLKEPNVDNVLKLVESYPRPENAVWLQAPLMGKQIAASIPKRSNSYDKRLRQSQVCLGGSLAALSRVLQDIMLRGKSDPALLPLARRVIDAMTMTGYVHADFNAIRKGAIRQVINPQYAGVFTRRTSSTPESLTGEESVPDQLKEQEELSKVRAKLQKPKRGNQDQRNDNNRGRGRGSFSGNFRGGSQNRGAHNGQGSGFGRPQNFQQRGRGARPNYPQQRRVYGHQHQGSHDQQSGKDQNKM